MLNIWAFELTGQWSVCQASSCQQLWCCCPSRPLHSKWLMPQECQRRSSGVLPALQRTWVCCDLSCYVMSIQAGQVFIVQLNTQILVRVHLQKSTTSSLVLPSWIWRWFHWHQSTKSWVSTPRCRNMPSSPLPQQEMRSACLCLTHLSPTFLPHHRGLAQNVTLVNYKWNPSSVSLHFTAGERTVLISSLIQEEY